MLLDNTTVAILTKLNELAERHGLKPFEFTATYRVLESPEFSRLDFETAPDTPEKQASMDRIMAAIGMPEDGSLRGTGEEIYNALEIALQHAPRARSTGDWGRFSAN